MKKKTPVIFIIISLLSLILFISGCSNSESSNSKTEETQKEENKYDKLVKEKNKELDLQPIELTSYSEEAGVTLKKPTYKEFAVNKKVVVEGEIEKFSEIKSDYVWIKVQANEEEPAGMEQEYYAPIKEGKFKQEISLFNGEGQYEVKVQVPSLDREDYYYETASFTVHNVNADIERDVTYSPFGQEAEILLNLDLGYVTEKEIFSLSGDAGTLSDNDTIMIKLTKESDSWTHVLPIVDGQFSFDVPLLYGKGVHELEVLVPDEEREKYYQPATKILINNESDRTLSPIDFSSTYLERGVTLNYPQFGGVESDGLFTIKGSIDPKASFGPETTHIYVTTKKGEDEALDVIPVEDFSFDDSFYLRFGPGTYEVMLSVPEIKEENSDRFRYFGFAKFEVESTSEDKRDLLPSRGVESDAPEIIELAGQLTNGLTTDREKAEAIYKYVASNISYDVEKYETKNYNWDDSALKTLQLKKGICQDYAYLTIALLRASNVEARLIEGNAFGGFWPQKHAWVEAKVDGSWLTMDPTWGAGYIKDDAFVAQYTAEYFDPNPTEFEKSHKRTGVSY
ncbi:transglutaminase domain-containing protein [Bacillus sp. Y1]|nr:transglutaminase-like domain-containing protein [Bacillus sp. Y1]AYA77570.1 transglutaminase domain-containing protein [Bacillus sp. Y1]